MINLLGIFSGITDTMWKIVGVALIAFIIYALIKFPNGRIVIISFLAIALLAITAYCGIQLNAYYSATGGIFGQIKNIYSSNEVVISDSVTYSFKNMALTQEDGDKYSAKITSEEVLDLELQDDIQYGVYVNGTPCKYVEMTNEYVIAEYEYIFYDEDFNVLMDDTLTFKFAFYSNSTYLSVSTSGGAKAVEYWNNYFNKNVFEVTIENSAYQYSTDVSFGEGDVSNYSTVSYYLDDELYIKQIYMNGSTINLPDLYVDWSINDTIIDSSYVVNGDVALIGVYNSDYMEFEYVSYEGGYKIVGVNDQTIRQAIIPATYNGENGEAPVTVIGNTAFANLPNLEYLYVSSSIKAVYDRTVENCPKLTTIVVAKNNPVFDSRDNCNAIIRTSLNELVVGCGNSTIPNTVTTIDQMAFYMCPSLTEITIPESVTTIEWDSFLECENLTCFTLLGEEPPVLTGHIFNPAEAPYIYIPSLAYETANVWKEYKHVFRYSNSAVIEFLNNAITDYAQNRGMIGYYVIDNIRTYEFVDEFNAHIYFYGRSYNSSTDTLGEDLIYARIRLTGGSVYIPIITDGDMSKCVNNDYTVTSLQSVRVLEVEEELITNFVNHTEYTKAEMLLNASPEGSVGNYIYTQKIRVYADKLYIYEVVLESSKILNIDSLIEVMTQLVNGEMIEYEYTVSDPTIKGIVTYSSMYFVS